MTDGPTRPRPARQDHDLDVLLATPLHVHIGLHAVDPADPAQGLRLTAREDLANNSGMLHGGMVSTALDVACAYAIFPQLTDDEVVLTSSFSVAYLRPIPTGSEVRIRAEVLRRGAATAFLRAEVTVGDRAAATAQVVKTIVTLED
jgi:uncharacterized protein (TIGR00369 family)